MTVDGIPANPQTVCITHDQLRAITDQANAVAKYSDEVRIELHTADHRLCHYPPVQVTIIDDAAGTSDTMEIGPAGSVRGVVA